MQPLYPWQHKPWQSIIARWQQQKLPHALLLTGTQGLGKSAFAQQLAARLLCPTQAFTAELACGNCQSCQWLTAGSHPDFFLVRPEEENKAIKIEQIRELLDAIQQTVQHAQQQVVIIEPAEAMNKAAANALLKTLEEPSGQVVFLLVTHQLGALPATIRSRCQRVDFVIPPAAISLPWLQQQLPNHQNIPLLLSLAENVPLTALAFAEQSHLDAQQTLVEHFIQLNQNQLTPLAMATHCQSLEWKLVFEGLWRLVMDMLRLQQAPTSTIAYAQQRQILTDMVKRISPRRLLQFLDQLMALQKNVNSKINLNMQLALEALFIEWVNT
jgi:DNA polymerase-3 subunit delta'